MGDHARLSPSGSPRWMLCAASPNLSEGIEDTESEYALEGTHAHRILLDEALTDWLLMGTTTVECEDEEMRGYLQTCLDYIIKRYNELPGSNKRILIETRVDLHYMTNRDDLWGGADVIIISDTYLDCIDLKYGAGIFIEADTSQTKMYLLGAMCAILKETREEAEWVSVRSTILQPRFPDADGDIMRFEDYDPAELMDWCQLDLLPAAKATDNPDAIPVPGAKQCQFCPAKGVTCHAVHQRVTDLVMPFQPVDSTGTLLINNLVPEPATVIDGIAAEQLMEMHDQIPFIEGYLKAVSARIRVLIEARDPEVIGRFKLVRARGNNKWSQDDDTLLLKELTTAPGVVKKSQITKTVVISAPQAMKLSGLKPAQLKKIQSLVVKGEGSLAIVPVSDPRTDAFPPMPFEAAEVEAPQLPEPAYDWL
jgi:hypothetical protein